MGRARSPTSLKAEKLYKRGKGLKLVEIAEKLGVSESTVRGWKKKYNWDNPESEPEEKRSEKQQKNVAKRNAETKRNVAKKGGQKGNINGVGNRGGTPKGEQHALKHGAYSKLYWDFLDPDEQDMIDNMPKTEEELLIEQIKFLTVRERRIITAINKYRNQKEPVVVYGVTRTETKRKFADHDEETAYKEAVEKKVAMGERLPGEAYDVQTTTENKDNLIARLEKELTSVQNAKTKAIVALSKINLEKEELRLKAKAEEREHDLHDLRKEMLDAQIEHMDAETNRLLGENIELEDLSETDQMLYGGEADESQSSEAEMQ